MTMFAFLLSTALHAGTPYTAPPPPALPGQESCVCPAYSDSDLTISGFVVDAQMILGADRRSVEERMATIFDVTQSSDPKFTGRVKVWHNVSEAQCGVSFDYGKKYSVPARYNDAGDLETDKCLMGW